eukprot:m.187236 g.187236  ORF g.187236 m.187236 type:complete len:142 (+) comp18501_c0_seq7:233-658(+)
MDSRTGIYVALLGICMNGSESVTKVNFSEAEQGTQVLWNTTFPHNGCYAPISVTFGWGNIYASLNIGIIAFLDNNTGKIKNTAEIPSQSCSIFSNSYPLVLPLSQANVAVVAGGNTIMAFRGTSLNHTDVLWRSPEFVCTI